MSQEQGQEKGEDQTELSLRLRAPATATAGLLPLFVEVTLANDNEATDYYALTNCDPWSPPFPVEFTLSGEGGEVTLPARSTATAGATPTGFDLLPHQARTFVLDLSELETDVPPGAWRLSARWVMRHEQPRSSPVSITFEAGDPADAPLIRRLRGLGGGTSPSWANLIQERAALDDEALRRLSASSRRTLLPYLILHEAVHGPQPLSQLPLEFLSAHFQGPWASEASVLTYELFSARAVPDLAARRAAILARWPGVEFRLDQVDRGAGLLTLWREEYR
ncbi:MAG TPA: hypothetical protein VMT03_14045 [Polyangia bacterium]|nr:hypothetical protein [Polyangia bacterium]